MASGLAVLLVLGSSARPDVRELIETHARADAALVSGDAAGACRLFQRAAEIAGDVEPMRATLAYGLACAHARAGKREEALTWFERAVESHYADAALAAWDEDLASLRSEDRFYAVLERMSASGRTRAEGERPGSLFVTFPESTEVLHASAIDPRGELAVIGDESGRLHWLELMRSSRASSVTAFDAPAWNVAMSPSGDLVAALSLAGEIGLWTTEGKELRWQSEVCDAERVYSLAGSHLCFSPDGSRLLAAIGRCGAGLWSLEGESIHSWDGGLASASWNADGSSLATIEDGQIVIHDRNGGTVHQLTDPARSAICVAFLPDNRLASGHADALRHLSEERGFLRVWGANYEGPLLEIRHEDPMFGTDYDCEVAAIVPSPDGSRLAYSTVEGVTVTVLDAVNGQRRWVSEFLGGRMGGRVEPRWASDGDHLWYTYEEGLFPLTGVELSSGKPLSLDWETRPPNMAGNGLAIACASQAVLVFDSRLGVRRGGWSLAAGGWVALAEAGYFTADVAVALTARVARPSLALSVPFSKSNAHLFDPKRVRAAFAGVDLVRL